MFGWLSPQAGDRAPMSGADHAWLRMDRASNPMSICGLMILDAPASREAFKAMLEHRFLCFSRLRQRPGPLLNPHRWETVPDFRLDDHVIDRHLAAGAGDAALQHLIARLMVAPWPSHRPLWEFHLIDGLANGAGAVAVRIHHCYADGTALIRVLLSMTDDVSGNPLQTPLDALDEDDFFHRLLRPANRWLHRVGGLVKRSESIARHPLALASQGLRTGLTGAELLLMPDDATTRIKGKPGPRKQVAWSKPLSLDEVKTVGRHLGCSVNDVLISVVAGAFGGYLRGVGDLLDGKLIRAVVPVNMRPPDVTGSLGNVFGLVFVELPVGIANPVARLRDLHRRMQALRQSPQPWFVLQLLETVGQGPRILQEALLNFLSRKASMVMTNVPGPQQPLYIAGVHIARQFFWVPQAGDIGVGVSVLSYDGRVSFGIAADATLVPDPQVLVALFEREFEALVHQILMADE